jgi:hypothetical protein
MRGRRRLAVLAALAAPLAAFAAARADVADVLEAVVRCRPAPGGRPASVCQFTVTVKHADTGWDHYANRYEIVAPDGRVLVTRILEHPHVDEQPFTRSQGQVRIPYTTSSVLVRAGDLVHGLGGKTVTVEIPHARESPAP